MQCLERLDPHDILMGFDGEMIVLIHGTEGRDIQRAAQWKCHGIAVVITECLPPRRSIPSHRSPAGSCRQKGLLARHRESLFKKEVHSRRGFFQGRRADGTAEEPGEWYVSLKCHDSK